MKVRVRTKGTRCPLCRVGFLADEESYECVGCSVRYHSDCADELGGCATIGCERMGAGPGDPTPEEQTRGARWDRHRGAARQRRAGRGRLRAEHQEEAANAGQSTSIPWVNLFEGLLAGLECLACLALSVVLVTGGLFGLQILEITPAQVAKIAQGE